VRVAYLGPEGTFTEEALLAAPGAGGLEPVPFPTVYDAVMAVHARRAERAIVPIENSLEGSVDATLDVLGGEAEDVAIVGESVHPIRHCLIARSHVELDAIETVVSHAQANAQCGRFIREHLAGARVLAASSTADAVRMVAEADGRWAALGNELAAGLYGCEILRSGVEDVPGNETRFAWLARAGTEPEGDGPWKTSILFWETEADAPGWLVRCLAEFADRDVNLTRIESRPRRHEGLGRYQFFADLAGRDTDQNVKSALGAVRDHAPTLRVLGSYPAA
jgi:prephenate dehydratase